MCIFCKIIKGEVPSYKVYEDDKTIAFLDIFPRSYGHTLVVPKKHFETIDEMDDEYLEALIKSVKTVSKLLKSKLNAQGYNIVSNNGKVSGQEVMHVHIHILPRYENDNIKFEFPDVVEDYKNKLEEIHKKIIE